MTSGKHAFRMRRGLLVLAAILLVGFCEPNMSVCKAHHFGFKGGFRGGFGRSFKSGFGRKHFSRKFSGRSFAGRGFNRGFGRVGSFRSFGFRGFNSFGRSRFNSLAFRSRRFGGFNSFGRSRFNRFNSFGGFNRFASSSRFRSPRFASSSFNRFNSFNSFSRPRSRTFAFSNFPTQRIHSGFGTFNPSTSFASARPVSLVSPTFVSPTFCSPTVVTSAPTLVATKTISHTGWDNLVNSRFVDASSDFVSKITNGVDPGESRIGYALAMASSGDLDYGVYAMKRAFARNADEVGAMMFDDSILPMVEKVTQLYETRMDAGTHKEADAFMLAALYQMQGDPEMASMAADYIKNSKSETATINLVSLVETEMKSIPMSHGSGWDLLADGRNQDAIHEFVKDIEANGKAGEPKLGYGVAFAATGDFEKAAWAIRRAFEVDAENVSDIMLDGKLRPVLEKITQSFEKTEAMPLDKDKALVLGTLYQLQGDLEGAEFLITQVDPKFYLVSMVKEEMESQDEMTLKAMPEMKAMDNLADSDDGPDNAKASVIPGVATKPTEEDFEIVILSEDDLNSTDAPQPVVGEIIEVPSPATTSVEVADGTP